MLVKSTGLKGEGGSDNTKQHVSPNALCGRAVGAQTLR